MKKVTYTDRDIFVLKMRIMDGLTLRDIADNRSERPVSRERIRQLLLKFDVVGDKHVNNMSIIRDVELVRRFLPEWEPNEYSRLADEDVVMSRSVQRRVAAQTGQLAPEFDNEAVPA